MICFECGNEIEPGTSSQMIGLDIPYRNLYFHRHPCFSGITMDKLNEYLASNVERIYNYVENKENTRKNK